MLSKRPFGDVPGKLIWRCLKRIMKKIPEVQLLLITCEDNWHCLRNISVISFYVAH